MRKRRRKRWLWILIAIAALGGACWAYWYRGQWLSEQAWDAYRDGQAADALALYRTVSRQYPAGRALDEIARHVPRWVPTFEFASHARWTLPDLEAYVRAASLEDSGSVGEAIAAYESFLVDQYVPQERTPNLYLSLAREALAHLKPQQARALHEDGAYVEAVEAYRSILALGTVGGPHCAPEDEWDNWGAACRQADLATEEAHRRVRDALPLLFREWADVVQGRGDHEQYVAACQAIVEAHPGLLDETRAQAVLAEVYAGWAARLREAGDHEGAIARWHHVAEAYPNTPAAGEAQAALPTLYREWASQLGQTGDHEAAIAQYETVLEGYPVALNREGAEVALVELYLAWAAQLRDAEDHAGAIRAYETVLRQYPDAPPAAQAAAQAAEAHRARASRLRADGRWKQAIEAYGTILRAYQDTPTAAHAGTWIAETYGAWAAALRAAGDYEGAIEKLATVLEAHPGTPTASEAEAALGELYEFAVQDAAEGEGCAAVTILDALIEAGSALAGEGAALMPQARYRCGSARFAAGEYGAAIAQYEALLERYPDHPLANDARAALVDAQVTDIRQRGTGELPPPQERGTAPPGSAVVVISNDSPERLEVLLSGPGSQSLTIDPCPTCKTYSIVGPIFCPEEGPRATITLLPGSYEVVVRAIDDPSIVPWSGEWALEDGREYFNCFYIVTTFR